MISVVWGDIDFPVTQPYNPPVHMGIDIGMPVGTRLYVLDGGVVERVQQGMLSVRVGTWRQFYLHIESTPLRIGMVVTAGEFAAYSGAVVVDPNFPITGPHLHFEVQDGFTLPGIPTSPGAPLDPVPFLTGVFGGIIGGGMATADEIYAELRGTGAFSKLDLIMARLGLASPALGSGPGQVEPPVAGGTEPPEPAEPKTISLTIPSVPGTATGTIS